MLHTSFQFVSNSGKAFYRGCNIYNLVIGLSIDVFVDVIGGINDSHVVSFNVRLRIRLGEGLGEE